MKKHIIEFGCLFLLTIGYLFFSQPKSSHFSERTEPIKYIIVHAFDESLDEMIKKLDELNISTHYLIDNNGKIIQLVEDDKVAWHAGKSYWKGTVGLNAYSIGIELQSASVGQTIFPEKQIKSFQKLVFSLMAKYNISLENILGHSDIAPTRKVDPGKMFPWKKLGIGPQDINEENMLKKLAIIGYDVSNLKAAILAYNRHFHPELVPVDRDIKHLEENLAEAILN